MNTSTFFEHYYNNAEVNSLLILDEHGLVLDVNNAFIKNFGYQKEDIIGKNFTILYLQKDQENKLPQIELKRVLSTGQSNDENYIIHKNGHTIWCTGESVLTSNQGQKYIVKDIVNLQAKKQLQLFLKNTEELLDIIFESSKDIPMIILDGSMKIEKANTAFLKFFEINEPPVKGSRLSDLKHSFWSGNYIKGELLKLLVASEPLKEKLFKVETSEGEKTFKIDSRTVDKQLGTGKQIFLMLEEVVFENQN